MGGTFDRQKEVVQSVIVLVVGFFVFLGLVELDRFFDDLDGVSVSQRAGLASSLSACFEVREGGDVEGVDERKEEVPEVGGKSYPRKSVFDILEAVQSCSVGSSGSCSCLFLLLFPALALRLDLTLRLAFYM